MNTFIKSTLNFCLLAILLSTSANTYAGGGKTKPPLVAMSLSGGGKTKPPVAAMSLSGGGKTKPPVAVMSLSGGGKTKPPQADNVNSSFDVFYTWFSSFDF